MKTCNTCPFWKGDPNIKTSAIQSANDEPTAGRCLLNPPVMQLVPVQNALDPRQQGFSQQPIYPITLGAEAHGCHPDNRKDFVYRAIVFAIDAWNAHLSYKPGHHPDTVAAGFSRIPGFVEATIIAADSVKAAQSAPRPAPPTEAELEANRKAAEDAERQRQENIARKKGNQP